MVLAAAAAAPARASGPAERRAARPVRRAPRQRSRRCARRRWSCCRTSWPPTGAQPAERAAADRAGEEGAGADASRTSASPCCGAAPRERRSALRALKRTSCKAPPPAHQGPGAGPAEPSQDKLAPANREHETARGDCAENLGGDGDGQKNELGHGAGHSADRQKTAHMKYFSGYDKPRGICTTRGRPSPQPARHARRGTRTASSSAASHRRSARRGESRAVASRKTRWLMRCMRAADRRRRPATPWLRASPLPAPRGAC